MKKTFEKQAINSGKTTKSAKVEAEKKFDEEKQRQREDARMTVAELAITVPIVMILLFLGIPTIFCWAVGILSSAIIISRHR